MCQPPDELIMRIRKKARDLSRRPDGPSHCQALDMLSREQGSRNWKHLLSTRGNGASNGAQVRKTHTCDARRNLRSMLSDRSMTFDDRIVAAGCVLGHKERNAQADVHLVALMAQDALDASSPGSGWTNDGEALTPATIVERCETMWTGTAFGTASEVVSPEWSDDHVRIISSAWFAALSRHAAERGRLETSNVLDAAARGDHESRVSVIDSVRRIRLMDDPARGAFETRMARRYANATSEPPERHSEDARATLDAHLHDEGCAFGDDRLEWSDAMADELVDADLQHWGD